MFRKLLVAVLSASLTLPAVAEDSSLAIGRIRYDAPDPDQPCPRSGWWKLSVVLAAAATVADSHSSWGRLEMNPALRNSSGRFGMQGLALKTLITGGAIGAQYILLRRHPKAEKYGVMTNMLMAGVLGTAAVYNYRLGSREHKTAAVTVR